MAKHDQSPRLGRYAITHYGNESVSAFVPPPLPPRPPVRLEPLQGVKETSEQATAAARQIVAMFDEHQRRIHSLGRAAPSVLRVFQHLQRNPSVTIPAVADKVGVSPPTVAKSLEHLRRLGIVDEASGRERNRLFVYEQYLNILNEATEPIVSR